MMADINKDCNTDETTLQDQEHYHLKPANSLENPLLVSSPPASFLPPPRLPPFRLLSHLDFHLIRISEREGEVAMTVVSPHADSNIMHEVQRYGYYCISHFWGPMKDCEVWQDSGIKDKHGVPVCAKFRHAKRNKFIRLLKRHGGYWWVDVFCTNAKTPLVIMGDVYEACNACFALIDCKPESIHHFSDESARVLRVRFQSATCNVEMPKDIQASLGQVLDKGLERYMKLRESGHRNKLWKYTVTPHLTDIIFHKQITIEILDCWSGGNENRMIISSLMDILECWWFTRVWTLQEAFLPHYVILMAESGSIDDRLSWRALLNIANSLPGVGALLSGFVKDWRRKTEALSILRPSTRRFIYGIKKELAAFDEIIENAGSIGQLQRYHRTQYHLWHNLQAFAKMNRVCSDPCDYVYGILGLLGVDIPRVGRFEEAWCMFLDALSRKLQKSAYQYDFVVADAAYHLTAKKAINMKRILNGIILSTAEQSQEADINSIEIDFEYDAFHL